MYKIKVNGKHDYHFELSNGSWQANGKALDLDKLLIKDNVFHIIHAHQSYEVEVVGFSKADKTASIKVNGNTYNLLIKDQFDDLLHQLGFDSLLSNKVAELKAPMPGLVLKVLVEEGDKVMKGDNLFVLEAMKMENIIKAPADLSIKTIRIKSGDKVEKNQVLMLFG